MNYLKKLNITHHRAKAISPIAKSKAIHVIGFVRVDDELGSVMRAQITMTEVYLLDGLFDDFS